MTTTITSFRLGLSVFKPFSGRMVKGTQRKDSFNIKCQGLKNLSQPSLVPSHTKNLRLQRREDIAQGHVVPYSGKLKLYPAQVSSVRQVPFRLTRDSKFSPHSHIRFFFPSKPGEIKSTGAHHRCQLVCVLPHFLSGSPSLPLDPRSLPMGSLTPRKEPVPWCPAAKTHGSTEDGLCLASSTLLRVEESQSFGKNQLSCHHCS